MVVVDWIIRLAALFGAAAAIFGAIFSVYRWYLKQQKQDSDIAKIK